jgi:hypothetical protein
LSFVSGGVIVPRGSFLFQARHEFVRTFIACRMQPDEALLRSSHHRPDSLAGGLQCLVCPALARSNLRQRFALGAENA